MLFECMNMDGTEMEMFVVQFSFNIEIHSRNSLITSQMELIFHVNYFHGEFMKFRKIDREGAMRKRFP